MFDFNKLKQYLDDNGIKQAFIAQKLNLTEATFSAIITGRTKCSLDNYVNICFVLGVPFGEFINLPKTTV